MIAAPNGPFQVAQQSFEGLVFVSASCHGSAVHRDIRLIPTTQLVADLLHRQP
jgi:hypothetical protein